MEVDPDSKVVQKATATRDDGVGFPRGLVDFHCLVEDREFSFGGVEVEVQVSLLLGGDGLLVFSQPRFNLECDGRHVLGGLVFGKFTIGWTVEVLCEGAFDV